MGTAASADRPSATTGRPPAAATADARAGRVAGYYRADQLEGDGWWGGRGAGHLGLAGVVEVPVLESVLIGRQPVTGERLVSARGASGRVSLKRGQHTRLIDGRPVWDTADAAARFDTNPDHLAAALVEVSRDGFVVDDVGAWWLTRTGIDQLARVFDTAPATSNGDVLAALEALPEGGVVSVSEAACLTGLSAQHLRKTIAEWTHHRPQIEASLHGMALPHERAWLPAVRVGGRWRIANRDLAAFWQRRTAPVVRVAYDVVATVEKSVSILTLLADAHVQAGCVEALLAANQAGMGWLDEHASKGRRHDQPVSSHGLAWAGFLHATSRALDPHPHVHNLVVNALTDPGGEGRVVDSRHLFQQAKAASEIATAQLRWELTRRWPGLRWEQSPRSGVWELAGVGEGLIEEFSTRRAEIEDAARQLVGPDGRMLTRREVQEISASTRPPKRTVDAAELLAGWEARAARHGFNPETITRHGPDRRLAPALSSGERTALFTFLATHPDGVCAAASTFTFGELLAAINRWAPGGQPRPLPADALVRTAREYLATELAIPIQPNRDPEAPAGAKLVEERWTTPHMVRAQLRILQHWTAGQDTSHLTGIPDQAIDTVAASAGLTAEQAGLVRAWTRPGHQFQAAIGRPGTGKTYTMAAARRLWEAYGWRVVGAAVKGTAAQHLTAETGIPADTIARLLTAAAHGHPVLDNRTILVVDEATTLSDRDLVALLHLAASTGAVLRMIGDPHQQRSVAAGGMWAHLTTLNPTDTPELVHQRRLDDPDEAHTAELLRSGRIRDAINHLLATGKLRTAANHDHGELLAVAGWLDRRQRGVEGPMISRRNHTRRRLNQITQTILANTGQVTDIRDYGAGRFGVGDRVITTAPDRSLHPPRHPDRYQANGTTGTITHTNADSLVVEFDRLGTVTIPADRAGLLDLGYALTAYSVQGATLDEAEAIATPGEPIESVYVALTRGRQANTLIATTPPAAESHQPDIGGRPEPAVELAETITDNDQVPALVADPDLAHLIEPSPSMPARIRERLEAVEIARAVRRAHLDPPAGFLDRHGPRPATPWLAERWDVALAAAATEDHLQERARAVRVGERRVGRRRPPGRGGLTR